MSLQATDAERFGVLCRRQRHKRQESRAAPTPANASMFCATWTECVWQIADASDSDTKFIISDHPVTVYNRACPHLSRYCEGSHDPDIRLHATHTYFPLSLDQILILTNLSWVRNPYQDELRPRPNPRLFGETIFKFLSIQVGRKLSEDEVITNKSHNETTCLSVYSPPRRNGFTLSSLCLRITGKSSVTAGY